MLFQPSQLYFKGMSKVVSINKKASFEYILSEKMEAGLELKGSEVKSLREKGCQLKNAFVSFKAGEAFLQKAHISPYKKSNEEMDPERPRKLLLHEKQILKLKTLSEEKGLTCVPTKVYFKKSWAKVEIAIGRGKGKKDKRESLKKRQADRQMKRALKKKRN